MSILLIMLPATLLAAFVERPKRRKESPRRVNSRVVW